ncbi:hypothetical protein BHE74_00052131 [Ensete ventricosum]|nr:hypothetical protein BHE74_00052131 [Ensete ventricosum]RZS03908.1 hypothetical protein BHM03_00034153 [Ensete ventricosum]
MDARRFFIGARKMCWLLRMSIGRMKTRAVASSWSRLLVVGRAVVARSLLRCSRDLSSIRGPCWLAFVGEASLFASASFRSLMGFPIVKACTKASVE